MYFGHTFPEIIVIVILFSFAIGSLIAALNNDTINKKISHIFDWFEERFEDANWWFIKLLYGSFLYPARFATTIKNTAWRNGMVAGALCTSFLIFASLISLFLAIAAVLLIIFIVFWLLGIILGSGSRRRY